MLFRSCFASDRGRIWCYQKQGGEFRLLELPTKARITSIHTVSNGNTVVTTDSDGFFLCNLKTNKHTHYSPVTCKELSAQPILSAYVDRTSEVWFEQEEPGVVVHFNPATGVVKREQMRVEYSNADRSRPAFHIHEDIHVIYGYILMAADSPILIVSGTVSFLFMMIWAVTTGAFLTRYMPLFLINKGICGFVPTPKDWRK